MVGRYRLGEGLLHSGRHEEAIAEFERALDVAGGAPDILAALGHAYALAGKRPQAERVLAQLAEVSRGRYVPAFDFALVHVSLGNADQAFLWLDRAYDERATYLALLNVMVDMDPVRSDPRFAKLVQRVGLVR
jgi:Flp pilus assembly protein TadD